MSDFDMNDSDCMSESSWGDHDDDCEFPVDMNDSNQSHMCDPFKNQYVALTPGDIVSEQQAAIDRVMELTGFPAHMARTFLQQMKWNFEKLAEFYYEDQERALAKVGLAANGQTASSTSVEAHLRSAPDHQGGSVRCEVCYDEIEKEDIAQQMTVVAGCGHRFCNECWRHHLHVQIEEGLATRIRCAGTTTLGGETVPCNIILDDGLVARLLAGGDDKGPLNKYKRRLMESYVNDNPNVKWCPGTDCTHAVRVTDAFDSEGCSTHVECAAGHEWCFVCSKESHSPAQCDLVKMWKQKCEDDSETSNWLQANTKDCPKCKVAINKDGGCNHMHCKQCDHHFCWICLGHFEHTTYNHTCNKFVADDEQVSRSRASLERYMHHFTRFQTHAKSRELEAGLRETTVAKMEEMQDKGNKTFLEVQFMKEATSQLIHARRLLQWSYVVGFYQPKWLQRNIFESSQSELENSTEELSFTFENTEVMELCGDSGRVKLIDQTKKVQKRAESLVAGLEEMRSAEDQTDYFALDASDAAAQSSEAAPRAATATV